MDRDPAEIQNNLQKAENEPKNDTSVTEVAGQMDLENQNGSRD